MVYEDLIIIYPKQYSIYLRGTRSHDALGCFWKKSKDVLDLGDDNFSNIFHNHVCVCARFGLAGSTGDILIPLLGIESLYNPYKPYSFLFIFHDNSITPLKPYIRPNILF